MNRVLASDGVSGSWVDAAVVLLGSPSLSPYFEERMLNTSSSVCLFAFV